MKKFFALLLTLLMMCSCSLAFAATPTFEVGGDEAEYTMDGASGWNVVTAFVKISARDDILFNGPVTLTSDSLLASEFTMAAIYEAGCGAEGVDAGFVTSIGDYVSGTDADGNYVYWGYTVNGKAVPYGCNQMVILENDYIHWNFGVYDEEAAAAETALPTGYDAPFEVGGDETEYEADGASGWTKGTFNVKIAAGDDVLYNGTVALTSDNCFASEATMAAIYEAGCGAEGVESGFVTSIGDYAAGTDADGNYIYWGFSVNGKVTPVACNQFRLLDGDYVLWELLSYAAE